MSRRPSVRKNDSGTEVYLSLVDLEFDPVMPPAEVLTLQTTCTNRDYPMRFLRGGDPKIPDAAAIRPTAG